MPGSGATRPTGVTEEWTEPLQKNSGNADKKTNRTTSKNRGMRRVAGHGPTGTIQNDSKKWPSATLKIVNKSKQFHSEVPHRRGTNSAQAGIWVPAVFAL